MRFLKTEKSAQAGKVNDLNDVICDTTIYADDTSLSILSVIRHLISGKNWSWHLNLNLIY